MLTKTSRILQRNSFWLVLLCHFLLFCGLSFEWLASFKPLKTEEDKPSLFIPSYVAHDEAAPAVQQPPVPELPQKAVPTSNMGIEKPVTTQRPSFNNNHPIDISRSPETEPVHLIGDKKIDRPLLTL